jgi:hypothetical protein
MPGSLKRAYTLDVTRLDTLMRAKPCGLRAIAKACRVHVGTVKKWRAGKQRIYVNHLVELAAFLGCTVGQLIGEEPYCAPTGMGKAVHADSGTQSQCEITETREAEPV